MTVNVNLPTTFEVRGAAAHFGNRSIKLARLRPGKSGRPKDMETVIPNASGARGQLIVPFAKLLDFTQLDARDTALYGEIKGASVLGAPDPIKLRALRLKIDQSHGATEAIKEATRRECESDATDRFQMRLSLIARMTRETGTRMGDRFMASASAEKLIELVQTKQLGGVRIDVDELTKRVFFLTGQAVELAPAELERRLELLVDLVVPFGTLGLAAVRKSGGYLIRQRHRLAALVEGVKEARSQVREIAVDQVDRTVPRLAQALAFVDARIDTIDSFLPDLGRALKEWEATRTRIQEVCRAVSWGLDGWDIMADTWEEAKSMARKFESPEPLEQNLTWIAHNMPILPRHEVDPNAVLIDLDEGAIAVAQPVKMMHGWRDGQLDEELARRTGKKAET